MNDFMDHGGVPKSATRSPGLASVTLACTAEAVAKSGAANPPTSCRGSSTRKQGGTRIGKAAKKDRARPLPFPISALTDGSKAS